MRTLKLISARIDAETLEKLDEIAFRKEYWKRNAIINGILSFVVDKMTQDQIFEIMRYDRRWKIINKKVELIPEM